MKQTFLLLAILAGVTFSCGDEQSTLSSKEKPVVKPLAKRTVKHADCGVKLYNSLEHKSCGDIFFNKRTAACGIELYHNKPNFACPGSQKSGYYEIKEKEGCAVGFAKKRRRIKTRDGFSAERRSFTAKYKIVYRCERQEIKKTCRHPKNGIERYKACRHLKHGLEKYKTCRLPAFGVQEYKTCDLFMPSDKIPFYLTEVGTVLPIMMNSYFNHMSNYFLIKGSKKQLACTIQKGIENGAEEYEVERLKDRFVHLFSEQYSGDGLECKKELLQIAKDPKCIETPNTRECATLSAYLDAKHWLSVKLIDMRNLHTAKNFGADVGEKMKQYSEKIKTLLQ